VKGAGKVALYSRRRNVLIEKFHIATALEDLPDSTVLDGELMAIDSKGCTDFNLLQNFGAAEAQTHYR
jgi:ATP-dependent DNA ligase